MTPEQFKSIRKHLGFTQKKFAKALGKGLRTIQDYEQGKYPVPLHVQKTIEYILTIIRSIPAAVSPTLIEYPPLKKAIDISVKLTSDE